MKIPCGLYSLFFLLLISQSVLAQDDDVVIKFDIDQQYQNGIAAISANHYDKALNYFFECYRTDPKNIEYANRLGYCYFQLGNFLEAKYTFEAILKQDSSNITALSNLAAISKQELNYVKAEAYYEQLSAIDSTNSYYYRQRAILKRKQYEWIEAAVLFSAAHEYNPKDLATINDLALLYLELQSLEYAEVMINKGMQLDSNNIGVIYTYARVNSAAEKYQPVIRSIQRAMSQQDSTAYYQMMLGVAYLKLDSLDAAITTFERVVNWDKASEHTHHYLAIAYRMQDNTEKSIEHFNLAIEEGISPKVPRYYRDLAELYENKKKYRKAYELFKRANSFKAEDELLFHIAHNADRYFKDKKIALRYYEQYAKTGNKKYKEYTTSRINQLIETIHQMN